MSARVEKELLKKVKLLEKKFCPKSCKERVTV